MVYIILQLALPPPLNILKLGAYRGIQECRNQFENDTSWWNCTFDWKRVDRKLPIFFNNTLPHGKKGWEGGGRHSKEIWVEVYGRGLQTLQTVLNTKIVHFASCSRQERSFYDGHDSFCFPTRWIFFSARIMEFDCLGKNIFGTTNLDHSSWPFCPKRHPFQDAK